MPLIGAGVYRNAVGTKGLYVNSRPDDVRHIAAACIPERSNLVDIYAEFGFFHHARKVLLLLFLYIKQQI
jgi:hypothetical protein